MPRHVIFMCLDAFHILLAISVDFTMYNIAILHKIFLDFTQNITMSSFKCKKADWTQFKRAAVCTRDVHTFPDVFFLNNKDTQFLVSSCERKWPALSLNIRNYIS